MNNELDTKLSYLKRSEMKSTRQSLDRGLVTLTDSSSVAAEQYRMLHYQLEGIRCAKPIPIVSVTSAVSKEGKTLTALNLALASARANPERKILLIDADVRRNEIARHLQVRSRPGLVELVEGHADFKECLRRFRSTNLNVLPSGESHPEPGPLFSGGTFNSLLAMMKSSFDEVYVDLPPALIFSDAAIVARKSDGVLLVVRAFRTKRRHVDQALERLRGTPLLGTVLNRVEDEAFIQPKEYFR